jgi:hypothetical protein
MRHRDVMRLSDVTQLCADAASFAPWPEVVVSKELRSGAPVRLIPSPTPETSSTTEVESGLAACGDALLVGAIRVAESKGPLSATKSSAAEGSNGAAANLEGLVWPEKQIRRTRPVFSMRARVS